MIDYNNLTHDEREALKKEFGMTDEQLDAEINKINDEADSPNNIPQPANKDDILRFIRDIFALKKEDFLAMNRTGNLSSAELGGLPWGVRKYNDVANYADLVGYTGFAEYSRSKTSNAITTSTSKKGFMIQIAVTVKKVTKNIGAKRVSKESSLFGGTKEITEGGEEE